VKYFEDNNLNLTQRLREKAILGQSPSDKLGSIKVSQDFEVVDIFRCSDDITALTGRD